jgi:murein endopeptidase
MNAGCEMNNQPKITQIPELINKDTGLREYRFRRYDCLHLRETTNTEECSTNEVINEEIKPDKSVNVVINEETPWMTEKSRTIVNPSLQRDSVLEIIIVKSYLRIFDKKQNKYVDKVYIFEGSLSDYKRNKNVSKYISLKQKTYDSNERVNATIYCVDTDKCTDVILSFAFTNYNISGQKFIDSRHFHIDDREAAVKNTDFVPGKAAVSLKEVKRESIKPVKPIDELIEDHMDDGFVEQPRGPVLPKEEGKSLCEGLVSQNEKCPDYLVDSNLEKPSINDTTLNEDTFIENQDPTQQSLFPLESLILNQKLYPNITEEELNLSREKFMNPTQLTPPKIQLLEIKDPELKEKKEPENKGSILAPTESIRPKPRPVSLDKEEVINFEENDMTAPLQSIDNKFTYNLALCTDHLHKAKAVEYNQASGFYSKGKLQKASHYSYTDYKTNELTASNKSNHYSSEITKQIIEFAGCVLKQRYKENLLTNINDLSAKNGGRLGGHASHQNGLDADVSYPHLNKKTKRFDDFTANMNDERVVAAIDMARIMIYTDRVKTLFTDNRIRKRFCGYIKAQGKLTEYRSLVEEYMYHVKGHHNHYHIRVKCNSQNPSCTVQGKLKSEKICG